MLDPMRVVYLTEGGDGPMAKLLRSGAAGSVSFEADGGFELEPRVEISANSAHALIGHGVVDELNALPLEGTLGDECEVLVPPVKLEVVRSLLFEADRKTYGAKYEFAVGQAADVDGGGELVEYRIRIDNREYQATLSHLTFLMSVASREGFAAWIRL